MPKRRPPTDISRRHYAALSRSPLHSLAFVAPLLALFHVSLIWVRLDSSLRALTHIELVFERLGNTASFLPAAAVALVLVVQHFAHRDRLAIHPGVLGCMLIESAVWMLPMIAILHLAGMLHVEGMLAADTNMPETVFQRTLLGVGAGVYEEFIFRLVLIGLIMLLLVDVLSLPKHVVAVAAVVVTAVAFGLYHPAVWGQGDFQWWLLLFYVVTGAYLGALYLGRGFAIVVGAHCLFNVYEAIRWSG